MTIEWRDVVGYEGLYKVSSAGEVLGIKGTILQPILHRCGYPRAQLYKGGEKLTRFVHRIVAEAFIPNLDELPQVNHIDGIKTNNMVENLEWCDPGHNTRHAYENGLAKGTFGERNGSSKLTAEQVVEIRENPNGLNGVELGRQFGVSKALICMIRKGQLWPEKELRALLGKEGE